MKGALISVFLLVLGIWSLFNKNLEPFFKFKRQRLKKNNNFNETGVKIENASLKSKRRR
jgi:hypothetical protein